MAEPLVLAVGQWIKRNGRPGPDPADPMFDQTQGTTYEVLRVQPGYIEVEMKLAGWYLGIAGTKMSFPRRYLTTDYFTIVDPLKDIQERLKYGRNWNQY